MYNLKLHDPHFLPHLGCDIQLNLSVGELVLITGENGIGKTTFLNRVFDTNVTSFIEQGSLDFFYDRPLKKIKELFLKSEFEHVSKEKFLGLWNFFGLTQKEDRILSHLSGGEGQVLKLVIGLSIERNVYFIDEGSQYLDENNKKLLLEILQSLIQNKKMIVLIEHDSSWIKIPFKSFKFIRQNDYLKVGETWNT